MSLVPLVFGTIKATLCAMLFAVPLALLAALYTSQFMSPKLKGRVKPVVEIMAAIPSVVIGFLAGLWLAPLIDKSILTVFLSIVIVPLMLLAGHLFLETDQERLAAPEDHPRARVRRHDPGRDPGNLPGVSAERTG